YIQEAIDSALNQTFTDFEVIAVDDGSEDVTPEILRRASRVDSRFRSIRQPHGGIIAALNTGLAACRAPYVARMDADDRAHPTRLTRQVAFLEDHPETAVVSCLVSAFPPDRVREGFRIYLGWLNALITHEEICREIFVESPLPHPGVTFRKEWVEKVGGYQERGWPEDYDLWLRLYLAGARFAKVPEVLLEWRERTDRLTRTDSRYSLENFLRAKAHYLARGPLVGRDALIVWGAGMTGRRLSKHLVREGAPLAAFVDIDPKKIGNTRRGRPVIPPKALLDWWGRYRNPIVLAAVGARGARKLIRERLTGFGLVEGRDWWGAA
ncbi:MAG: glycosyltransferase, partial [Anaerolineales bacterium]